MVFSAETLELMRHNDRVFTKYPFFDSRQIVAYLPRKGSHAGRHRLCRLMKVMELEAIYKQPNTSKKHAQHKIYTDLLRKLAIDRRMGHIIQHKPSPTALDKRTPGEAYFDAKK